MKASGLYIHIPFCERKCLYCDFTSGPTKDNVKVNYINALIKELKLYREAFGERDIQTLFIGGGTPSSVPPSLFEPLLVALHEVIDFSKVEEFTIEANPGTVSKEKFLLYKKYGVNRLSFGVQSFNDHLLGRIGRLHNKEEAIASIKMAQTIGFDNINIDLMHNLPDMTPMDLYNSVEMAEKLGVSHISLYSLILEEGTPLYREFESVGLKLLDEVTERQVFHKAIEMLAVKGYHRYEVSNFAKTGRACQHNLLYWHLGDYIGLGVSAHGKLGQVRYYNVHGIPDYIAAINRGEKPIVEEELLSLEDGAFETIMLGLRLTKGIDLKAFHETFAYKLEEKYEKVIEKQVALGTLLVKNGYLYLTPYGHDIANQVTLEFMD